MLNVKILSLIFNFTFLSAVQSNRTLTNVDSRVILATMQDSANDFSRTMLVRSNCAHTFVPHVEAERLEWLGTAMPLARRSPRHEEAAEARAYFPDQHA